MPIWRLCLAIGAILVAGYLALPDGMAWHAAGFTVVGGSCVGTVVLAVRHYRPQQAATWYTFIAGLGVWLAGSIVHRISDDGPWVVARALLSLAGYPFMGWALVGLIRGRARAHDRTAAVDMGIVATSLGLLYWSFVAGDTVGNASLPMVARLDALASSAGDIVLFTLGSLLLTTPGARTASYRLLIGALVLTAVSDVVIIVVPNRNLGHSGPADVISLVADVLTAAAAAHPSMRRLTVPRSRPPAFVRPRLVLLAIAILLAPTVSLVLGATGRISADWLATGIGSILLFVLVTARMAGLVRRVESQSRQLFRLAHYDALTGLPNRRHWDERLAAALAECAATGESLVVGIIDLDRFKRYNDTHGHQAGDELLAAAATAWRKQLRAGDLLARYGGEEFGLLLPARSLAEGTAVAERLLATTPMAQTFSAGVALWDGAESADDLVRRADGLLYAGKDAGRARVTTDAALPTGTG